VARDSAESILRLLFLICPRDQLFKLTQEFLELEFGEPAPAFEFGTAACTVSFGSPAPGRASSGPLPMATASGGRRNRPLSSDVQSPELFQWRRCYACEPSAFGSIDKPCEAMKLMASLETELKAQADLLEREEAESGECAELRRTARFYMYRKYVTAAFDRLGKGVRVRIPLCVVERIRDEFRAPGCTCPLGGPLARCDQHGYTGHRDGPGI
jgi:hypothetical protein